MWSYPQGKTPGERCRVNHGVRSWGGKGSGDTLREKIAREGSGVIFTVKAKGGGVWIQHGVKHHM